MRSSMDFWYLRISRTATVPARKRGFLRLSASLSADLEASSLRGALDSVLVRAVCFAGAIVLDVWTDLQDTFSRVS